jgi:hypothetical protein
MFADGADIGIEPFGTDPWRVFLDRDLTLFAALLRIERIQKLIEQDREGTFLAAAVRVVAPDGLSQ